MLDLYTERLIYGWNLYTERALYASFDGVNKRLAHSCWSSYMVVYGGVGRDGDGDTDADAAAAVDAGTDPFQYLSKFRNRWTFPLDRFGGKLPTINN